MDLDSFEGPERVELAPGYTVSRVIAGSSRRVTP